LPLLLMLGEPRLAAACALGDWRPRVARAYGLCASL
jgi:hypothetical protein